MGKGIRHIGGSASKHSHYSFKRRCSNIICKKRAKHKIGNKFYCKLCIKEI